MNHVQALASVGSPTVSVVIPLYNGASVVPAAVDSVLSQQFTDLELILVDDRSTDESLKVAQAFAKLDPRVTVVPHDKNRGVAASLNTGLRRARGEFVLILHQDCRLSRTDWVTRALALIRQNPSSVVIGRPRHNVTAMSRVERLFWIARAHVYEGDTKAASGASLFSENKCDLFARSELMALGGFDESVGKGGEDQILALELSDRAVPVIQGSDLWYQIYLGTPPTVAAEWRRDFKYGRQMRTVLTKTRFRAVRRTDSGEIDQRLLNRLAALAWTVALVTIVLLVLVFRWYDLLLVGVGSVLLRFAQLVLRGARHRSTYGLNAKDLILLGIAGLGSDLCYVAGLAYPGPAN